jgi:hypothetical protein
MNGTHEFVRSTSAHLDIPELLKQPVTELLAVAPAAATALAPFGINTIFDLGCSRLFADARIAAFAKEELGQAAMHGIVPGDLLDDTVSFESIESIGSLPLQVLRNLSKAKADVLSAALNVTTLRDFAQWPPYVYARRMVSGSFGGTEDRDAIQTEKLRPTFGEFPTERVYYTTLTMLQMNETAADGMKLLDGGVSLDATLAVRNGFTKPAIGALLTYSQSWYVQGITFGHLLHSLALAPGEATRIAIVDWARRTLATSTEAISETEQLDSATSHARALSEVQNAVSSEMQEGGSMSTSHADSSSYSAQASVGTGLLTSLWASGDVSGTTQGATTDTTASSSSWSLGNRSVAASMTQNINDRTEQHSTSARNRRATAVREVSQSEHEQVSTRIVANYNHMHALTIQYYEIVQVYRVATRLHRAERCLFIPMERLLFVGPNGEKYVERFRGALVRAALNSRARELLLDDASAVEISASSARIVVPFARPDLIRATSAAMFRDAAFAARTEATTTAAAATAPSPAASQVRTWDRVQLATASRFLTRSIVRPGSDSLFVPDDTELLAITFDNATVNKLRLDRVDPQAADTDLSVMNGRVDLPAGVRMGELDGIYASRTEGSQGSGQMTLLCGHLGRRFTLPSMPVELGTAVTRIASFRTDQADRSRELLAHLQAHNAYYTQAILRSLDSATLVLLLSDYTWNGRPVIDQVEPKPVTVAGNFLVLRAPVDADQPSGVLEGGDQVKWNKLLEQRGFNFVDEPDARVIPIPTNGVFAEAVLGRSNSAEKLEYTRFWNWQDSPIPLQPTEIAPVGTGSRATAEDLRPGQLGQPVLNIVNPTSLPDPAGLGAALTALANGNMFRDMSGLAGTQALAGQMAQGTLDAATAAAEIASANMRAQMQKAVAMGQIAADLAKTAMGMPSTGGGNNTISAEAARVAHGEQRDAAGLYNASGASGGDAGIDVGGSGGSSSGGDGSVTATRAMFASSGESSAGGAAFNRALWGPLGMPGGELAKAGMAMANDLANADLLDAADNGGVGGGGGTPVAHMAFDHILLESVDPVTSAMVPGVVPTTPAALTTAFYNADVAGTTPDATLQQALTSLINSKPAYKNAGRNFAVSLVDLSGANKFAPKYAGFNDLTNFYGASVNKITGLLGVYQLLAEANELLKAQPTIADSLSLENEFKILWTQAGIAANHHPLVAKILAIQPGSPPTAIIRPELVARLNAISTGNENGSTPIVLLKFPYVGSTMLAHGLFSSVNKGGIWTRKAYGNVSYLGQQFSLSNWSTSENPHPKTEVHNINAVSLAQFYTLAAQRRMIDNATSKAVLGHLQTGGCTSSAIDVTALFANGQVATKCGIFGGWVHDTVHFKETATLREFVVVILTQNGKSGIMKNLFKDLVALVP